MGKKNKSIHLTIEGQLEYHYLKERHTERNEILWHAWCQNRRWLSQLLETTMSSFPTFSKHDESHARTVLHNIEMILGEKRIKELSASDCFMLLHTVYIHDIGMVITYEDREKIVQNDKFIDMVKQMEDENDPVFQRAIKALQRRDYSYDDEDSKEEQMKKLYSDKLAVYYAILHLIASFRRPEHGELSNERLEKWTLESEKLGSGFSMAGIPQRIFLWIAKCAGLHTDDDFQHVMDLPQEDNGYASDYLHPRFVAVLLQLGDILDMDNDRFHPLTRECIGVLPELSKRHYEKHQAIRRLYIRPDTISIEADCKSQEALRLVRKECDMLRGILTEAGYYWSHICPENFKGSLPTIEYVKLYLDGVQIPEELVTTQFKISQKKAFSILEGSNVYKDQFVFLREFLQNAIDASKIQYWNECVRTRGYYRNRDDMRNMSPDKLGKILSTDIFPIEIEMEIVKQNEEREISSVGKKDVEELLAGKKSNWNYGVKVRIKDFGTGIDKESIKCIARVGDSRKRERYIIQNMPEWLRPTAEFGIGLQSAFILTNAFKCRTYTRSNEKYEIVFSTVKSNYYEGYINVRPVKEFETYGTCFEVFIPVQKKLRHELYPAAWDGKDFYDKGYETLRPLRHSAELLAQMALYLDELVGEQLFPVHLNVVENPYVTIPLNLTEKNQIKKLKYKLVEKETAESEIEAVVRANPKKEAGKEEQAGEKFEAVVRSNFENTLAETAIKLFDKREWEQSGKSWTFCYENHEKGEDGIVIEKTENAVALLDCRDGHLYFWDNELCTFCLISMVNFLLKERRQTENPDKHCEKNVPGVRIYYKGIELEERELPGIGNELLQYIDIKGKLEREYINLSRKGFTEKGEEHFLQNIYAPLLESVLKVLKVMNRKHPDEVVRCVRQSMDDKVQVLKALTEQIDAWNCGRSRIAEVEDQSEWIKKFEEEKRRLLIMFKENVISITMLAFFAQKDNFEPLIQIGCGNAGTKRCCWSEVIECVRNYCGERWTIEEDGEVTKEGFWDSSLNNSVLFHIEHRSRADLTKGIKQEIAGSGFLTFPDIFSDQNQFMVVSRRENRSAPWKQYLTPIEISENENAGGEEAKPGIIQLLKRYSIMDSMSGDKVRIEKEILRMGDNALAWANTYGIDEYGGSGAMSPGEYLQQYFLKWLLRYIPTIALFMSKDGNTRVNIIHSKIFPSIFMNDNTKRLILQRIWEESERYGIQRFSIPAWQGLEYLSCRKLPYSHFFVKRGYLSEESYSKVIFPFSGEEMREIRNQIDPPGAQMTVEKLYELRELLNVRRILIDILMSSDDWEKIESVSAEVINPGFMEKLKSTYSVFLKEFLDNGRRAQRVLDKVKTEYRNLVANRMNQGKGKAAFSLSELEETTENWAYICIWLFLRAINSEYLPDLPLFITNDPPDKIEVLDNAWRYVLENQYMQNAGNVVRYQKDYEKRIEQGQGLAYEKRERILTYIEKRRGSEVLRREYLQNCWARYVDEIFGLFRKMEEEQYRVLEGLADRDDIERKLNRRGQEGLKDANNKR